MPRDKIIESPAHDLCGKVWSKCRCQFCGCCGQEYPRCACPQGPTGDYLVFLRRGDTCQHKQGELWRLGKLPHGRRT